MWRSLRAAVCVVLCVGAGASAQPLGQEAQQFYAECSRAFRADDYSLAAGQCQVAERYRPGYPAALRLLARSQLALGQPAQARASLEKIVGEPTPEDELIRGEVALRQADPVLASRQAAGLVDRSGLNPEQQRRALRLAAEAAGARGLESQGAGYLERLLAANLSDLRTRRELADIRLKTNPGEAVRVLADAPFKTAPLLADLGRAQWIAGRLPEAIVTLERAVGDTAGFRTDQRAYNRALGALAYAYYGSGNFSQGGQVLTQVNDRLGLFSLASGRLLPWVLGVVLLLALHLVGESRIEPLSTIEIQEGPRPWTVSNVYSLLLGAVLAATAAAVAGGWLVYGNLLALLTPAQSGLARDLHFGVFAAVLVAGSLAGARRGGWKPRQILLGPARRDVPLDGLLLGLLLVGLTVGYRYAARSLPPELVGGFYLDLATPRNTLVLPLLLLPLAELFFRAYALYPFEKRYGRGLSYLLLAVLYGLSLGSPILLLVLSGLVLLAFTHRARSTGPAVVAQWVYYAGLAVAILASGDVRSWF